MAKASHPDFDIKKASAGLGLFAKRAFKKGEELLEYTGEHISHEEADLRGGLYLFTLSDDIIIDGKGRENIGRYLNHSCDPNTEAVIEDDERIYFEAIKDIAIGDELTFDYGEEYVSDIIAAKKCKCDVCMG